MFATTSPVTHDDLIVLTEWMAETGDHSLSDIAEAVRKPWNYVAEVRMVRSLRAHQAANPGHCPGQGLYGDWGCDTEGPAAGTDCSWPDEDPQATVTAPTAAHLERAALHGIRGGRS